MLGGPQQHQSNHHKIVLSEAILAVQEHLAELLCRLGFPNSMRLQ